MLVTPTWSPLTPLNDFEKILEEEEHPFHGLAAAKTQTLSSGAK